MYSDSWTFTGTANYNNIAATTVADSIAKANATVTVTPYDVTYDGHSHTALVASISGVNGETGSTVGTVDVSNTTHTNAGMYSDSWTFTGTANYNNIAATTIADSIAKANATVNVTPYNVTYDGSAHTAMATATGVNSEDLSSLLTLGGTTHSDANDYPNDGWGFAGNGNYNASSGTVHDQIIKANATVSVTPYSLSYDGNAHTATGSATGVKGESLSGLNLEGTTHTNAATYNDTWMFNDTTGNYNNATGTVNDVIAKANAMVNVTPYSVTYDGNAHSATGTITGVKGESLGGLDLSATTHVNADSYTDTWVFTDSTGNYNSTSGTVNDVISKATATVSVTPYNVTFDGNAHTAMGSTTGVKGEILSGLSLGGTTHTNAATYDDTWTFSDTTGNYNNASGTVQDLIKQANATIVVTPYSVTYDGNAHIATATATGVSGVDLIADILLTGTSHTNAGSYAADPWIFHDAIGNYADASGTVSDVILKADQAALALNAASPLTYSQSELLSASGGTTNGALTYNLVSGSCAISGNQLTAESGTGSCILTATMAGNDNYKDVTSSSVNVTLAKANQAAPVSVVAPSDVTYGASGMATATGGNGTGQYNFTAGGTGGCSVSEATVNVVDATMTCTLAAIRAADNNYNESAISAPFVVTLHKANQEALTLNTSTPLIYKQNESLTTGGGSTGGAITYNLLSGNCTIGSNQLTANSGTGVCTLTATMPGNHNYNDVTSTPANSVTLAKAQPVFSVQASQSIVYATPSITLAGTISAPAQAYPSGQAVSITINGATVAALIGANGSFTASFDTHSIPASSSAYTISYSYPGDSNFNSASNVSTALNVKYASGGVCDGDAGHQILQPINVNGTSVFNVKSTSPAKFRVCDASGVSVGTPGVVKSFVLYQIANGTATNTVNESVDSTTPDSTFRWDPTGQQWIFNISNKNLGVANQTYYFMITLNDGTTIPFNYGLK